MKLARSEQRKATAAATSSARPRRFSVMPGRSSSRKVSIASSKSVPFSLARFSIIASVIGVAMKAGMTTFTSTLSQPYALDRPLVRFWMPALDAQ